ncbi:MAG TPA: hypothetical protein VFI22_13415, partial [Thermomicrobiales bacterium]|nr:hypothetical protein [Thermomicrobiales bacterium]
MNRNQVDALTRQVAASRSRREFVGLILGGTLAAGVAARPAPVAAEKRPGGRKRHGGCAPTAPTGARFTVSGRDILDLAGNAVLLRGVNKMSVFDDDDPTGDISFPEIAKTGANTVRIVWAIRPSLKRKGPKTDPDVLAALIDTAIANRLVPMIELHDATGNWSRLGDLVAYWTQPQIVDIIAARQSALLVNIGNEVGDDRVSEAKFI